MRTNARSGLGGYPGDAAQAHQAGSLKAAYAKANGGNDYEEKCLALASLQRNYETMSRQLQLRQQQLDEMGRKYEVESARCVSLSVQLEDALARTNKAEGTAARLAGLQEKYAAMEAEHAKLKFEASVAVGKATATADRMANLQRAAEAAEFQTNAIHREREACIVSEGRAKAEMEQVRAELGNVRSELQSANQEVQAARSLTLRAQEVTHAAERHATTLTLRLAERDEQISSLHDQIRSLQDALQDARTTVNATEVALSTCRSQQAVSEGAARSLGRAVELAGEERRLAVAKATRLEQELATSQESLAAGEQRIAGLTQLLAEAEDKYQASLVRDAEAGEGLTRLQVQLAATRATLADTRRQMADAEHTHMAALQAAQAATAQAEARLAEQVTRAGRTRHQYTEFLQTLVGRVDKAVVGAVSMQSRLNTIVSELADRQQKSLAALGYRLSVWEAQASEFGERVDTMTQALRRVLTQASMQQSRQAAGAAAAADAAATSLRLKDRVAALETLLAAEQAGKAAAVQSKARAEEVHEEALAAVRASADERVQAERQRLTTRLHQVEAEVARLQAACDADRAAAAHVLDLERQQMMRTISASAQREVELQQEIDKLQAAVVGAGKHELARLHRCFNDEMVAKQQAHVTEVMALNAMLTRLQGNMTAAKEGALHVLADMGVVVAHLAKMGWQIHQIEQGIGGQLHGVEDPDGELLAKVISLTRLHFSYVTEAVQNMAKKPAPVSQPPVEAQQDWTAIAKELKGTVAKLLKVEESLAPSCTCMLCLEVLRQPVTCVPCGHTYCKACLDKHSSLCVECGDRPVQLAVECKALEAIVSKYDYKLSALQAMSERIQPAGS